MTDLVLVVLFSAIGMRTHEGGFTIAGLLGVAWPFAAGAVIGWLVARAWRRPAGMWPAGVLVWLFAVVAGLILRVATGGGFAISFGIVTLLVLGLFLIGWRALVGIYASLFGENSRLRRR